MNGRIRKVDVAVNCEGCRKTVVRTVPLNMVKVIKFCSDRCRWKLSSSTRRRLLTKARAELQIDGRKVDVTLDCENCGETVTRSVPASARNFVKFCSERCSTKHRGDKAKADSRKPTYIPKATLPGWKPTGAEYYRYVR